MISERLKYAQENGGFRRVAEEKVVTRIKRRLGSKSCWAQDPKFQGRKMQ